MSRVISLNIFNNNSSNNNNVSVRQALRWKGKKRVCLEPVTLQGLSRWAKIVREKAQWGWSRGPRWPLSEKMWFGETRSYNLGSSKSRMLLRGMAAYGDLAAVCRPPRAIHQNHIQLGEKRVIKRKSTRSTTEPSQDIYPPPKKDLILSVAPNKNKQRWPFSLIKQHLDSGCRLISRL